MNMESLDLLSSIKDLRGSFSADTKIPRDKASGYLQGLPELRSAISLLTNISLSGMASVKLMNRTDVKYILNANILPTLIRKVAKDYFIQEIDGSCVAAYGTIYLDTKDLRFFRAHMNGKLNRFKWRVRSYIESNLSFLEIKIKSKTDRTQKSRIVFNRADSLKEDPAASFIRDASAIDPNLLVEVLQNNFSRLTLVNRDKTERLTIDLDITFKNCLNGKTAYFPNLCILEIKRERFSESTISKYLNEMRIKKAGISKYCLGVAMTAENAKSNLYKQKIRYIKKHSIHNEHIN